MLTRRELLGAGLVLPFAGRVDLRRPRTVVTTDFAVPHLDPDDFYDVACAVALGVSGVVLDRPTDAAVRAVEEIGGRVLDPALLRQADAVVVIGAATNAAQWHRAGQRVVLFAGDADDPDAGYTEANVSLDPPAYTYLRGWPETRWVPCFAAGPWANDGRASWVQTTDQTLLDGSPARWWFDRYVADVYGLRNLWVGPLLRLAWTDRWRGHTVTGGTFQAGPGLGEDMVDGTRRLLASPQLPAG